MTLVTSHQSLRAKCRNTTSAKGLAVREDTPAGKELAEATDVAEEEEALASELASEDVLVQEERADAERMAAEHPVTEEERDHRPLETRRDDVDLLVTEATGMVATVTVVTVVPEEMRTMADMVDMVDMVVEEGEETDAESAAEDPTLKERDQEERAREVQEEEAPAVAAQEVREEARRPVPPSPNEHLCSEAR